MSRGETSMCSSSPWEMALPIGGPERWEKLKSKGLCQERMSKRWPGPGSQTTEDTMMKNLDFSLYVIKTQRNQKETWERGQTLGWRH